MTTNNFLQSILQLHDEIDKEYALIDILGALICTEYHSWLPDKTMQLITSHPHLLASLLSVDVAINLEQIKKSLDALDSNSSGFNEISASICAAAIKLTPILDDDGRLNEMEEIVLQPDSDIQLGKIIKTGKRRFRFLEEYAYHTFIKCFGGILEPKLQDYMRYSETVVEDMYNTIQDRVLYLSICKANEYIQLYKTKQEAYAAFCVAPASKEFVTELKELARIRKGR